MRQVLIFPLKLTSGAAFRGVFFLFIAIFLFIPEFNFADVSPAKGSKIFKQYCTSCHRIEGKLIGPQLKDIDEKEPEDWLIKWIHNNPALRAAGDKDAIAIYEEYQRNAMPAFLNLSDDDIKSILSYVKEESNKPAATAQGPAASGTQSATPSYLMYVVIIVLCILVFLLMRVNTTLKRLAFEKLGEPIPEERPLSRRLTTKPAIAFYVIAGVFLFGFTIADSAMRLGHSKNYTPEQPIHFSHQLHAGINQINCLYCHVGAEKSKVASIPSINVCMNCHAGVQAGQSDAGTQEIKKIYTYYDNNKAIPWIKIHNLPDHVYFNHSQHVVVGKVKCQTCHGPVETMDVVNQYSSLSMGWCINCHRQTGVQFASNNYYSMYETLQHDFKDGKIDKVTEEMMGGTECQKCHY
ncbi:MAG: c-type cytochrome [Chitinophagales bacterium]|nr:c-type cytochrome [Chitinophagales bacterium]